VADLFGGGGKAPRVSTPAQPMVETCAVRRAVVIALPPPLSKTGTVPVFFVETTDYDRVYTSSVKGAPRMTYVVPTIDGKPLVGHSYVGFANAKTSGAPVGSGSFGLLSPTGVAAMKLVTKNADRPELRQSYPDMGTIEPYTNRTTVSTKMVSLGVEWDVDMPLHCLMGSLTAFFTATTTDAATKAVLTSNEAASALDGGGGGHVQIRVDSEAKKLVVVPTTRQKPLPRAVHMDRYVLHANAPSDAKWGVCVRHVETPDNERAPLQIHVIGKRPPFLNTSMTLTMFKSELEDAGLCVNDLHTASVLLYVEASLDAFRESTRYMVVGIAPPPPDLTMYIEIQTSIALKEHFNSTVYAARDARAYKNVDNVCINEGRAVPVRLRRVSNTDALLLPKEAVAQHVRRYCENRSGPKETPDARAAFEKLSRMSTATIAEAILALDRIEAATVDLLMDKVQRMPNTDDDVVLVQASLLADLSSFDSAANPPLCRFVEPTSGVGGVEEEESDIDDDAGGQEEQFSSATGGEQEVQQAESDVDAD